MNLKEKLEKLVLKAAGSLRLPQTTVVFTIPKQAQHGDLSTNIAMILSKEAGKPPRALAEELLRQMAPLPDWIEKGEVAGAGFLNFFFKPKAYFESLSAVLK